MRLIQKGQYDQKNKVSKIAKNTKKSKKVAKNRNFLKFPIDFHILV